MPKAQGHIVVRRKPRKGDTGDGGLVISITPDTILWKEGKKNLSNIGVRVFVGAEPIPYSNGNNQGFVCSALQPPEGIVWRYNVHGGDGGKSHFEYVIMSNYWLGGEIEIPFTVTYKDVIYDFSVHITSVCDGQQGDPGKDSCIYRQSEWCEGVEYRNDEKLESGTRFIDVAFVTTGANTYKCFKCLKTHVSSSNLTYENAEYWQRFNNMQPIYTPLIIAPHGVINFAQTNQLLVTDNKGMVMLGLGGGDYPLWIGGSTPDSPNTHFKVGADGYINARGGSFSGLVRHRPTRITPLNYTQYLKPIENGNGCVLNIDACGTYLIYEDSPFMKWRDADPTMQQALRVTLPGYNEGQSESYAYENHFELIGNKLIIENRAAPPESVGFVPDIKLLTFNSSSLVHTVHPETVSVGECQFKLVGQLKKDYAIMWIFQNTRPKYYRPISNLSDNGVVADPDKSKK